MSNTYQVAGKQVHCAHCGQTEFESRKILLNTRGATLFNVDWLNKGATTLTCQHCSHIEWFAQEPQVVGPPRLAGGR
jgi:predicted nucleic-acid-binding Zn-ribbon protein